MKYRCIRGFTVPKCDDDGFGDIDEEFVVQKDSVWELSESKDRICGGEVRLDNDNSNWLEISRESLKSYFEPMKEANHA